MPLRSSDFTSVNRLASSASCAAYASRPTLVAVKVPAPATTKLPDITWSPGCLRTESGSPVSRDSSISRPSASVTSPSTITLSPMPSSTVSSSTISPTAICSTVPSRRTCGRASPISARLSRVFLARSSWMMPIAVLATMTRPKRPSWIGPTTRMIANITPMIALKRVKTLARTISLAERLERTGTSLTSPRATRSATSAAVRPPRRPGSSPSGWAPSGVSPSGLSRWASPRRPGLRSAGPRRAAQAASWHRLYGCLMSDACY